MEQLNREPFVAAGSSQRPALTSERVARAALDYLDRHGLDSLSMRRLARELDVGAMTLYGYFRSKDELLDAVVDVAVAGARQRVTDGPWQDQLKELMRAARHNLDRHPALTRLRARRPVLRPEALRFAEATLTILTGAGFEAREAALCFRLLFTYVFGYASFSPQDQAQAARAQATAAIRALPPEEYPQLTAAGEHAAAAMGGDEAFEYGLDRIVDGFAARLAART